MSTKILTFIDIGGHEKYSKTLVSGFCSQYPEYSLLVVSVLNGISKVTEQHIQMANLFQIPLIVVMTHIDLAKESQIDEILMQMKNSLKAEMPDKIPIIIKTVEDIVLVSRTLFKENPIPIFMVSNLTGQNLDLFKGFLNLLPVINPFENYQHLNTEFFIDQKFEVDHQVILAGTVIKGSIRKNQQLCLGPDNKGQFHLIEIHAIRCKRVDVRSATCGQNCTISIEFITENMINSPINTINSPINGINSTNSPKNGINTINSPIITIDSTINNPPINNKINSLIGEIRRGMVLLEEKTNPRAAYEFLAEISLYDHSNQDKILRSNYQPVINTQTTRQACKLIITMESTNFSPLELKKIKSKSIEPKRIQEKKKNIVYDNGEKGKMKHKNSMDCVAEKQMVYGKKINNKEKINRKKDSFEEIKEKEDKKIEGKFVVINHVGSSFLRLRFKYFPEYINVGQKLIINDSCLKAIGWIKEIYY